MTASQTHPKAEAFFANARKWREEFKALREIALGCQLIEDYKWMHPCYTLGGKNIVLIHGFKEYCALLFFKGALLKDPERILIQQSENVQAARQARFTDVQQVHDQVAVLKAYIHAAIEVEQAGLQVVKKNTADYAVPEELQAELDGRPELRAAFQALTPGRQRGYLHHIGQAKQAKTRAARVEKCAPLILAGKGLDDD